MPVDLTQPFSWQAAAGDMATMLDGLQPNIIKPHTREFLTVLFLQFGGADEGKAFVGAVAGLMKSAMQHLQEIKAFKATGTKGSPYVGLGLSERGYAALGIPPGQRPTDPSFQSGMKNADISDPPTADWQPSFNTDIDAIVLVGDQMYATRNHALAQVNKLLAQHPGITVLGIERGNGLHNKHGEGIEHFGYVDGRSQPLFLTEDIDAERATADGVTNWDPAFAPERVLVPDPAAPNPDLQFGSYFIFRKLEQNVKAFKTEEISLATRLGLVGEDAERAGAMIVGRFEDGTPLTSQFAEGAHNPVPNDFNYDSDPSGGKCPFFAHIRKVNPRGSGGFESEADERMHIMPRRGQTYGVRTDDPNDGELENKPTKDVGLLFMAFNVEISQQFEFAQNVWANNAGFPSVPAGIDQPGLDLVIGHGARPDVTAPLTWGADPLIKGSHKPTTAIPQTVTMKGGEYFFMPSLPFLQSLAPAQATGE